MKSYSSFSYEKQSFFLLSNFFAEGDPIPYNDFYPGKEGTLKYSYDFLNGSLIFNFNRLTCALDSCSHYNDKYYPSYDLYLYCTDISQDNDGYTMLPRCEDGTSIVHRNTRMEDMNEEIRVEFSKESIADLRSKCKDRFFAYLDASLKDSSEQQKRSAMIPFNYKTTFVNILGPNLELERGKSKSFFIVLLVLAVILSVFAFVFYRRWKINERRLIHETTVVREVTMADMGYERAPQSPNETRTVDMNQD
jgi:hypothetical protein